MIYSVDLALGPNQSEDDWSTWVGEMKTPSEFMSLPGFLTMQRFKELTTIPPRYLAMYSVLTAETVTSREYHGIDGGNLRRNRWLEFITLWHRNIFDGLERAPAVAMEEVLLVTDSDQPSTEIDIPGLQWIHTVGLKKSTPYRGLAVLRKDDAARWITQPNPAVLVYAPTMAVAKSPQSS